ncbi:chaperonin: PROVISIONAL [Gigaspora margarita]|uniref:Chaperonin: PROVISIONAL n=1 Tax=Gigaspora margarita TaxID=4874 RepID=A0A8H4ET97_GIGMA|nr:chaperonin: PROVISIONAL [Gigaspora margarita]
MHPKQNQEFFLDFNITFPIKQFLVQYGKIHGFPSPLWVAAVLEKQYYNNYIEESKNNLDITHICYNWAQNISIPYSPQQSSLYFKSPFPYIFLVLPKLTKEVYRNNHVNAINDIENIVHKKYLYTKICQHVDNQYKDILCSQP